MPKVLLELAGHGTVAQKDLAKLQSAFDALVAEAKAAGIDGRGGFQVTPQEEPLPEPPAPEQHTPPTVHSASGTAAGATR